MVMVTRINGMVYRFFMRGVKDKANASLSGAPGEMRRSDRQPVRTLCLGAGGLIAATFGATASAEAWVIIPRITMTESYTYNASLLPAAAAQADWVTEASPGVHIEHSGPKANIYLDYGLHRFFYTNQTQLNSTQNVLNSHAKIEAIDNWLFLDAQANVSQQNRSAFGTSSALDAFGVSSNRVETSTYQVAPYIRGQMSDIATYQLRFNGTQTRTNDLAFPDTKTSEWVGQIKSASSSAKLHWSIDGNSLTIRNGVVGKLEDSRIRGSLIYAIDSQLRISFIGGREITDYATPTKTTTATYGLGLEWSPTPRTRIAAVQEKRFFGDGYVLFFGHRTPLTAWRLSSSKDVTVLPNQLAATQRGSIYDLISDLLTSSIPDPLARGSAVERRLQDSGIPANAALGSGFLTARPFLNRNHEASLALLGATNTVTLSFSQREQQVLGPVTRGADSFSLSNNIRQRSFNFNWSHKLSALSSLALIATSLRSEALDIANLESRQYSVNIFMSTQIGPKTVASFGARHVKFESSTNAGYQENALLGSLAVRF